MAKGSLPQASELKDIFNYDESSGKLYWRPRPIGSFKDAHHGAIWNKRFAGKEALISVSLKGYLYGSINGAKIRAHQVVWAIMNGEWASLPIDHINAIRTDNRIENLRVATNSQNQFNRGKQRNNTSGYKGVFLQKGRWMAKIGYMGRPIVIGYFASKEDAYKAYCEEALRLHGEFAKLE